MGGSLVRREAVEQKSAVTLTSIRPGRGEEGQGRAPGGRDWQSWGSVKGRDLSSEALFRLLLAVSLRASHRTF